MVILPCSLDIFLFVLLLFFFFFGKGYARLRSALGIVSSCFGTFDYIINICTVCLRMELTILIFLSSEILYDIFETI